MIIVLTLDQTGGDFQPYGSNRDTRTPDGVLTSFSSGFSFLGGMSIEFGTVTDNHGGKIKFKAINANIGFGLDAGFSSKDIFVSAYDPDGIFTVDDFLNSYTHEIEGGWMIFDLSKGWQANVDKMTRSNPHFYIEGGGLTIGLNYGLWWTRSVRTTKR